MKGSGNWVLGGTVGLLGVAALVLAGRSHDAALHLSALGIFVFCVLFVMMLIRLAYDREHKDR